jgi:hypothetical protein
MATSSPHIVASDQMPFEIQTMVFEEDTYLVLSAGNPIREIRAPLEELQHEVVAQQALKLGELAIRGSRVFAIVHDFDLQPSFSEGAVQSVLDELCQHVENLDISALGMQALGSHHGDLPRAEAIALIESQPWPDCLERLWVSVV